MVVRGADTASIAEGLTLFNAIDTVTAAAPTGGGIVTVITSYSIHYTKLYDGLDDLLVGAATANVTTTEVIPEGGKIS